MSYASRVWGWPVALGLLTATGLVSALVSDRWGDWWSWFALGVPVVVMIVCVIPRRAGPAAQRKARSIDSQEASPPRRHP